MLYSNVILLFIRRLLSLSDLLWFSSMALLLQDIDFAEEFPHSVSVTSESQRMPTKGIEWRTLAASYIAFSSYQMIADKDKRDYVMFQKEMATVFVNRLRYLV